jgi:hypothetical protein
MTEPSDPKRLADADPSSRLGQLMTSARQDVPSEEQLAALAEQLGSVLGPAHEVLSPQGRSTLVKLAAATGVAALLAGGVIVLRVRSAPHPSQSALVSPTPPPAAPSPIAAQGTPAVATPAAETPALTTTAPGSSPARASPPPSKKLAAEAAKSTASAAAGPSESSLLEQARRALPTDPGVALALTNQEAALFPRGVLVQEREVIAIEALRRLNRTAEADRRAAAFSKAFPGSAHQRVIEDTSPK